MKYNTVLNKIKQDFETEFNLRNKEKHTIENIPHKHFGKDI